MLIRMMVFFLALLVVGGLTSVMVIINPDDAHRAAFPFAAFFAGLATFVLAIIGGIVGDYVSNNLSLTRLSFAPTRIMPLTKLCGISRMPLRRETEAKGHPRSEGNRLLAPCIAFDCARHSTRAMIRVQHCGDGHWRPAGNDRSIQH